LPGFAGFKFVSFWHSVVIVSVPFYSTSLNLFEQRHLIKPSITVFVLKNLAFTMTK